MMNEYGSRYVNCADWVLDMKEIAFFKKEAGEENIKITIVLRSGQLITQNFSFAAKRSADSLEKLFYEYCRMPAPKE